jgi:hypothetical protein
MIYRSSEIGLKNRWDLWSDGKGTALISTRGTTMDPVSNLSNFYAAMVPAKGILQVSKDYIFKYELASDPRAAVHVGWLTSSAFLIKDIMPKIDSLYKKGTKDIIITGHSQGGAITYLLTSYLRHLQKNGLLASDIQFKTYASAAPKVGNLYYAYDYEAAVGLGWSYNVVSNVDWVPESLLSIQTFDDFSSVNGFSAPETLFPGKGLIGKYVYGRLKNPAQNVRDIYINYLGKKTAESVQKVLMGFIEPEYYKSMNYVRAGITVPLLVDEDYYRHFPDDKKNLWIHHLYEPYYYLANKLPQKF